MDLPVEIRTLDLHNVPFADTYVPKLWTTMMLDKDLTGRFTVEDHFTKSMASTTFDAGIYLDMSATRPKTALRRNGLRPTTGGFPSRLGREGVAFALHGKPCTGSILTLR